MSVGGSTRSWRLVHGLNRELAVIGRSSCVRPSAADGRFGKKNGGACLLRTTGLKEAGYT
jgi:hypothetical protein